MSRPSGLGAVAIVAALALTFQPAFANHTPTHTKAQIKKLNKKIKQRYTKAQVDALLAGKADTGSSYTKAESDALYGLARTIVVSPAATPALSGTALRDAVGGIAGAAVASPYLVVLEPGVYHLGSQALALPDHVSLTGSGIANTEITCACGGAAPTGAATLVTGVGAEVRSLAVENVDTDPYVHGINVGGAGSAEVRMSDVAVNVAGGPASEGAVGIWNPSHDIALHDVDVFAGGGAQHYTGIEIGSLSGSGVDATVVDVRAAAEASSNTTSGLRVLNADALVEGGHFRAEDAGRNHAIYAEKSRVFIRGVQADAIGGGAQYYAIYALNARVQVVGSILQAVGAEAYGAAIVTDEPGPARLMIDASTIEINSTLAFAYGVGAERLGDGEPIATVDNSKILSGLRAVALAGGGGATVVLLGSGLYGDAVDEVSGGTVLCTAVRDEDLAFFATTCPP